MTQPIDSETDSPGGARAFGYHFAWLRIEEDQSRFIVRSGDMVMAPVIIPIGIQSLVDAFTQTVPVSDSEAMVLLYNGALAADPAFRSVVRPGLQDLAEQVQEIILGVAAKGAPIRSIILVMPGGLIPGMPQVLQEFWPDQRVTPLESMGVNSPTPSGVAALQASRTANDGGLIHAGRSNEPRPNALSLAPVPVPAAQPAAPARAGAFAQGPTVVSAGGGVMPVGLGAGASPLPMGLADMAAIARRWAWLIGLLLAVSLVTAFVLSVRTPRRWRATAQLILVQRTPTVSASPGAGYVAPMVESIDSQVTMLESHAMAQRTIDWLKNDAISKNRSPDSVTYNVEDIQKGINASAPKDTNLIDVQVEGGSREDANTLANAVCQAFVSWKKDVAQENVRETLDSLESRADKAKTQMIQAEWMETAYKQKHQVVNVPAQEAAALEQFVKSDAEVTALTQELASEQAHLQTVAQQLQNVNNAVRSGTGVRDDALVTSLQQQLSQLEIDREAARQKYTQRYPGVLPALDARIQDLQNRLSQAISSTVNNNNPSLAVQAQISDEYRQLQDQVAATKAKLAAAYVVRNQLKQHTVGLPQTSMEYARLAREADMARSLYSSLQSSLNEARINKDLAGGNVQISQLPYAPQEPFRPDIRRDLLYGLVVGLGLSILSILLLEQSDRRVRDVVSLRSSLPGPVIGSLPKLTQAEWSRIASGQGLVEATEAYSLARANLALALRDSQGRESLESQVILVTSAIPREGKSVTAANLARSMARSGKTVILVDADMRRPSQNRLFNTDERIGLADVLTGKVTLEEALVSSDTDNLSILHCGSATRSPTDLISMPQMAATLYDLRREADVVMVDSPACSVVADALLLAPHVDTIIYVIGVGHVDENLVRNNVAALGAAAGKTITFFLNWTARDKSTTYRDYYYDPDTLLKRSPTSPNGKSPRRGLQPYTPSQNGSGFEEPVESGRR